MIDYQLLFASEEGHALFNKALLKRAKFTESPDVLKFMIAEDSKEQRGTASYIVAIEGDVGIVNISGGLVNDDDRYNKYCGLLSYEEIIRALAVLCENNVKSAIFNYDTPGGEGGRMLDVAEMISNLPFPTVGHTSTSMCSAGYFLGCQHTHVYSNEMASVGSVGVYLKVSNLSKMYANMGVSFERFRSGDLKATGDPAFALTGKEKAHLKEKVSLLVDKFYSVVSQARGIPVELLAESAIATGRTFSGTDAVTNYLVDGVQSFEHSYLKAVQLAEQSNTQNNYRGVN